MNVNHKDIKLRVRQYSVNERGYMRIMRLCPFGLCCVG